jgi:beta-fructofuranosidase
VGDYDGRRFTARSWQELAGFPCYATTVFTDAQGRRSAFSWLRETGDADGQWAGALSVPWLLDLDGDRVTVGPHPDVETLRTGDVVRRGPEPLAAEPTVLGVPARADVGLRADPAGAPLELTLDDDGGRLLTVVADPAADEVRLTVPDGPASRAPLRLEDDGAVALRLLLDAGVVEAFPGGGAVGAARLRPPDGELRLGLSGAGDGARLRELVLHNLSRVFG